MTISLKTVMGRLTKQRRAKIAGRAKALIAEEMTLQDLRKAHALTQERLAELLGVRQESISNIENRSDVLLSTLRAYVAAMGGDLTLTVSFPGRPPISVRTRGDQTEAPAKAAPRKRRAGKAA